MKAAVRFLIREPLLRIWGPALAIGDTAWTAFFVAVPVLVVARFVQPARSSAGCSRPSGSAPCSATRSRSSGAPHRRDAVIATFILGQALPLWLLTLQLPATAYAGALAVSGIANGIVNPRLHATMTLRDAGARCDLSCCRR